MIVGLDMGGTHVDGVIIKDGEIKKMVKKPTQREDLFLSIWETLEELTDNIVPKEISRINLSTTISTNVIVEDKLAEVGMIIQTGPGLPRDFLACGKENLFISGYVDHRGKVAKKLVKKEILTGINGFKEKGISSVAIVSKFSPRNPSQELEVLKLIEKKFHPITLGHHLSGRLNFPRRVFTAYLNSAVYATFQDFAKNIKLALEQRGITAPLFILKADGGTMMLERAEKQPVETILSGPAASLMGLTGLCPTKNDGVLLDIGGTTTDLFFLADGVPLFEPLGIKIGRYKTLVRSIYSHSIGLGGDSSIEIEAGELKIGPRRAGKPIALGGPKPTPTDALIVLGQLDLGDGERAREALEDLGKNFGLSPEEMGAKVLNKMGEVIKEEIQSLLKEVNSKPVYTIQELLHGKKIIPEKIGIIGGPAKFLAPIIEKKLGLPCHCPRHFPVANAIGAALAKPTTEINLQADTELGRLVVPELEHQEKIKKHFALEDAKKRALELLEKRAQAFGAEKGGIQGEIIEAESFNMVRGFYTGGKNIRVRAQVKPGLIQQLREE